MDEAEFGIDDISEEEYKRLKEKTMAKKKKIRSGSVNSWSAFFISLPIFL